MPRDEVSWNEWARNKLHAECAKLRGVICLTPRRSHDAWQLFLPISLSLSFTHSSNPLFFSSTLVIAPRTIGARRSQWLAGINDGRSPPSVTASLCLSSERWSVVQWCYETCELTKIRTHHSYIASV